METSVKTITKLREKCFCSVLSGTAIPTSLYKFCNFFTLVHFVVVMTALDAMHPRKQDYNIIIHF